ncbi:MAG: hypothetical protein Q7R51_00590 [bacterium]|nr:hypothetical protein [bacterium]
MKTEKIILSFIATVFGLLVAGGAFYLFQATKTVTAPNTKVVSFVSPTPTPMPSIFLTLDQPKDEDVVNSKVLVISGKTTSNAVITILTDSSEDVVTPADNGNFSITANLSTGQNIVEVTAIAPNGESITIKKTVTYSLEEF